MFDRGKEQKEHHKITTVTPPANVLSHGVLDSNKLDTPSIGIQLVGRSEYDGIALSLVIRSRSRRHGCQVLQVATGIASRS
ncbi:hypothetical protein V6N13_091183 [Hibiscus sabdariffa]|uniref:Uncharacterized protein n=1 Tax=Hibiscus sabdariffa TaxID=183260 RepID=A0ABR2R3T0_9ROSI